MIPLKDGNQTHLGVVWGGINPSFTRYGVQYFPDLQTTFKTWNGSLARFMDIMHKANADTYLTIHPLDDNAWEKIHAVQYRKPGDPHPFFFQAEDGIRDVAVTGVQTCALPI